MKANIETMKRNYDVRQNEVGNVFYILNAMTVKVKNSVHHGKAQQLKRQEYPNICTTAKRICDYKKRHDELIQNLSFASFG